MSTSRTPAPTRLAFHASRIVVDVGVLIVMAGMSLPFVTAPSGNRSSMVLDALPAVALLAPIFLITLIPDHTRPIPRILGWISLVLGLAAFPYAVVKYLDSGVLATTLGGGIGMGARLLVFGAFVTLIGIVIGLTRSFLGLQAGGTPGRTRAVRTADLDAHSMEFDDGDGESPAVPARAATPPRPAAAPAKPAPAKPTGPTPDRMATPSTATPSTPQSSGHPQPRPRPTPSRPAPEENPFGSPLFDSIEVPALPASDHQATLSFEAEDASERNADED